MCSDLTNQSKHVVFSTNQEQDQNYSLLAYARFPALGADCMLPASSSDWFMALVPFLVIGQV